MKSSLSLTMLASLCLFGCGKKDDKSHKKIKSEVVAEATAVTTVAENDAIPLFTIDDADDQYAYSDVYEQDALADTSTETVALSESESDADLFVWEDATTEADAQPEFQTVLFDFDKSAPRADQKELLEADVLMAKAAVEEGNRIKIHGHTDQIGSAAYNIALSEKRAQAVKTVMIKEGVPAEKIDVMGFGQEVPLVWSDAQTREEKIKELALNRRAEIFATTEEEAATV
jgi:outer membrane protein OmpA-like peptidoglycan-associated protein